MKKTTAVPVTSLVEHPVTGSHGQGCTCKGWSSGHLLPKVSRHQSSSQAWLSLAHWSEIIIVLWLRGYLFLGASLLHLWQAGITQCPRLVCLPSHGYGLLWLPPLRSEEMGNPFTVSSVLLCGAICRRPLAVIEHRGSHKCLCMRLRVLQEFWAL